MVHLDSIQKKTQKLDSVYTSEYLMKNCFLKPNQKKFVKPMTIVKKDCTLTMIGKSKIQLKIELKLINFNFGLIFGSFQV